MVKSMTGFGRAQDVIDGMSIAVEIKSVNHRYFEFSSRVPRVYGFLDEKLKGFVQARVARGKVECFVQIDELESDNCVVSVNHSLASGYIEALNEISEKYGVKNDLTALQLSKYPDILVVHKNESDEDKIWDAVKSVTEKALNSFIEMRCREGEKLRNDLESRCGTILEYVSFVEQRSPETVKEYNEKLIKRIQELLADANIDQQRILTEAAVYADKIAVDEETVRLRSHISQLFDFMTYTEAVGRKLDFLIQEMNREANTIGSKAQDVEIARKVIAIKAEIEKIREQAQNIE